jgi:hypothetical protein
VGGKPVWRTGDRGSCEQDPDSFGSCSVVHKEFMVRGGKPQAVELCQREIRTSARAKGSASARPSETQKSTEVSMSFWQSILGTKTYCSVCGGPVREVKRHLEAGPYCSDQCMQAIERLSTKPPPVAMDRAEDPNAVQIRMDDD